MVNNTCVFLNEIRGQKCRWHLYGALGFDACDGCVDVLWHDVAAVEQAARHVLAVTRVTLHHLIGRLKARRRYLSNRQLLVVSLQYKPKWPPAEKQ